MCGVISKHTPKQINPILTELLQISLVDEIVKSTWEGVLLEEVSLIAIHDRLVGGVVVHLWEGLVGGGSKEFEYLEELLGVVR